MKEQGRRPAGYRRDGVDDGNSYSNYSTLIAAAALQRAVCDHLDEIHASRRASRAPTHALVLLLPAARYVRDEPAALAAREGGAA